MKTKLVLLSVIAIFSGCVVSTPGPSDINDLMTKYVSDFGDPTYILPSIDAKPSQKWIWTPLSNGKTLTVIAVWWKADWATDYAWKVYSSVEE